MTSSPKKNKYIYPKDNSITNKKNEKTHLQNSPNEPNHHHKNKKKKNIIFSLVLRKDKVVAGLSHLGFEK